MLVPAGKILTTHGLKGEVKVSPFLFDLEVFLQLPCFYLDKQGNLRVEVESIRCNPAKHICIVKFKGLSLEEAEQLKGKILYIDLSRLPSAEKEEFYYYQLLGAEVVDVEGTFWGKVIEIMPVGEYELLLVSHPEADFYIPLIEEYVSEVDTKEKKITVKDIKGLFEVQK